VISQALRSGDFPLPAGDISSNVTAARRNPLDTSSHFCVSAIDCNGRTPWISDAHRENGKHFVVRADEKLTAFVELERVTSESLRFLNAE
jgi:hypothetical protein